jgi:hypothetical protein
LIDGGHQEILKKIDIVGINNARVDLKLGDRTAVRCR